jgi:hypothetical protein
MRGERSSESYPRLDVRKLSAPTGRSCDGPGDETGSDGVSAGDTGLGTFLIREGQ